MRSEQYSPIRFYSVLITHLYVKDLLNRVHVEQSDCSLSLYVEQISVGKPSGRRVL